VFSFRGGEMRRRSDWVHAAVGVGLLGASAFSALLLLVLRCLLLGSVL